MRIYTEVNFRWDDKKGKLVEVSSESFDYSGEMALCKWEEDWESLGFDDYGWEYQVRGDRSHGLGINPYYPGYQVQRRKPPGMGGAGAGVWEEHEYSDDYSATRTTMINRALESITNPRSADGPYALDAGGPGSTYGSGLHQTEGDFTAFFIKQHGSTPYADPDKNEAFHPSNRELSDISSLEFDRAAVQNINDALTQIKKIVGKGETDPDIYEQELLDAVTAIESPVTGLGAAKEAMTTFTGDLKDAWNLYESEVTDIEDMYTVGDTWVDANNDGEVQTSELTDTDGDGVLTPPGTHVQTALKEYGIAEAPYAKTRDDKLDDLDEKYGDPFIDKNANNMWDEGEPFGKEWVDTDGDNIIDEEELSTPEGAVYEPGTEYVSTQEDYLEGYRSIFGSGGDEDRSYTHEEAVTEGIITEQADGTFKYADGTTAPSPDEWLEGSYHKETRGADVALEEGYEAEKLTREGALESLRAEAKEKIRSADAKRGAAGFAASTAGGTARDILAKEIGRGARDIEEAHAEGRESYKIIHGEAITGALERKTTQITGEGGIETVRDDAVETYYKANIDDREDAVETYGISESSLASTRDEAIETASLNMDPETGLIPRRQYELEEEVGTKGAKPSLLDQWEAASTSYLGLLESYGATGATQQAMVSSPFELKGTGTAGTIRQRAEAGIGGLLTDIEDVLSLEATRFEAENIPEYEDFEFWTDPRSPFKDLWSPSLQGTIGWAPGADFGTFQGDTAGLFDPVMGIAAEGGLGWYDPSEDYASWLYDPGYTMPWQAEGGFDYTEAGGTWNPFSGD